MTRKRAAILISGRGSNMAALIEATKDPAFPAEIVLVLSNKADAAGLALAAANGIPTAVVSHRDYPSREAFDAALNRRLEEARTEIVCLAGFMRVLTPVFVDRWAGRAINIHPSLLPALPGLNTHERALALGLNEHGCTVHFVSQGVDEGAIIAQAKVPVAPGDTPDTLAARVLEAEHRLYPLALRKVASVTK
jgi:formyltetrahydrofolate-dependent phosphoribosylglycinamide formyltransferase